MQKYLKKIFEPIIEIEKRRYRIVIYILERQAFNFSTVLLERFIFKKRYFMHLMKLRLFARKRKIRVGFWLTENQKWNSQSSIYEALLKSEVFEPFILLTYFREYKEKGMEPKPHYQNNIEFFEKRKIKYYKAYDPKTNKHKFLKEFKPDIVFYQQPWAIHENQSLKNTSKSALLCYTPYCFYSMDSYFNYLLGFHGCMWKYFCETQMHKKEYETKYNAKNCVALGSVKLDEYIVDNSQKKIWKTENKKRIIYSPHHTFDREFDYATATFEKNGDFILELAKKHPETEWIFRPHPAFKDRVLKYKIKNEEQIEQYFKEWENIGTIYTEGDYIELFKNSDCLITDCISFLAEYLPSKKPCLHLKKDNQRKNFNNLLKIITDDYYQIYDNETLENTFNEVIIKGNDYKKDSRINNIKHLLIDKNETTGEKISKYLQKELWR